MFLHRLLSSLFFFFFLMIRRPPRSTLLSLHDALPISPAWPDRGGGDGGRSAAAAPRGRRQPRGAVPEADRRGARDRKSVVEGKRVDLGGRRIIKKKKKERSKWSFRWAD